MKERPIIHEKIGEHVFHIAVNKFTNSSLVSLICILLRNWKMKHKLVKVSRIKFEQILWKIVCGI
jgi:hypothetical protein